MDYIQILDTILKNNSVERKKKVRITLMFLGLSQEDAGFMYLEEAILIFSNEDVRKIYTYLSKKFHVSYSSVERGIRHQRTKIFRQSILEEGQKKLRQKIFNGAEKESDIMPIKIIRRISEYIDK